MPAAWNVVAPAIDWKDEEVWLFLLEKGWEFNRQYRFGFNRCGCLVCPYQSDYTDLLIEEYYPHLWSRWVDILTISYERNCVERNYKWTLNEYINGKWKTGHSKEQELISKKATPERIQKLADIKGISYAMASKYFGKTCKNCGKKLNPSEIAMFYKLNGRYEDYIDDNRGIECKTCYCKNTGTKPKEYMKKLLGFVDSGCNLF